jgi:hypothetical protein
MTENRRQVLEMLAAGKVTAEQAERLMAALERDDAGGSIATATQARPASKVRFLRVLVDGVEDGGPLKVNVRVPLQLLRAGVRLASFIPSSAQGPVNEALHKEGISIDLTQIKPENLEDLIDSLAELTVDVDVNDKSETMKVRVFCE